jgi:hypothetical protein
LRLADLPGLRPLVDPGNYYVHRIEGDGIATRYGAYALYTIYASLDAKPIGNGITSSRIALLTEAMSHLYNQPLVKMKVVVLPA